MDIKALEVNRSIGTIKSFGCQLTLPQNKFKMSEKLLGTSYITGQEIKKDAVHSLFFSVRTNIKSTKMCGD